MPKFAIERDIPGAGKLSPEQLQAISQKSCGVLKGMGPRIQWVHSYVTDDKVYCEYIATDEGTVREHAQQGGFPANRVSQIQTVIAPHIGIARLPNPLLHAARAAVRYGTPRAVPRAPCRQTG